MVKNNIEVDIKVKILEGGFTQERLGAKIGTTSQYVNRIIKKKDGLLNKTFIQMMEALGYDIELVYVPREKKDAQTDATSRDHQLQTASKWKRT